MGYTESYACGVQVRPLFEARETEAGITEEGCVLKEAHGFGFRREYHYNQSPIVNQKGL